MQIQKIKATNFKTYLSLDLDLQVEDECPIILIGGQNYLWSPLWLEYQEQEAF